MAGDVSSVVMFNCLWWWFGLIVAMIMMTHQLVNFSLMIIILLICIWNFYICSIAVAVPAFITFNDAFWHKTIRVLIQEGSEKRNHQQDHLNARKTTTSVEGQIILLLVPFQNLFLHLCELTRTLKRFCKRRLYGHDPDDSDSIRSESMKHFLKTF